MSNHEDLVATMLAALKAAAVVIPIGTGVLNEVDEAIEKAERHLAPPEGVNRDMYEALKVALDTIEAFCRVLKADAPAAQIVRAALAKADACR